LVSIIFLILFPLLPALILLVIRNGRVRSLVVTVGAAVLAVPPLFLLAGGTCPVPAFLTDLVPVMDRVILGADLLVALFLCGLGFRNRKYWIPLMVLPQAGFLTWNEFFASSGGSHGAGLASAFSLDSFSLIMALIVSIVGGLVLFFSLRYMKEYHAHHPEVKDRQHVFFSLFFLFFSAMYGIIFSDSLIWLYFFWELTTLASFLLIGYSGAPVARRNARTALLFNLLGGICFAAAIGVTTLSGMEVSLSALVSGGGQIALIAAVLLSIAGFTKSAQFPFSAWLKGAMVAPTPVSALLHSSTMVKAGVFLIIKLSPVFSGTVPGLLIALTGAFTFLCAAFIAISRRDAKELLAYSTISNLGLIVLCAGVGSAEAIWAAILLLVFHAIAKALLFLSVGLVEHRIGSRTIEAMDGLLRRMPKITYLLLIGIAGMFLAPFGMLISKWAALKALVDVNPLLAVIVVFGGTATLFFWTKWMGKLTSVRSAGPSVEKEVRPLEWFSLVSLALLTVAVCMLFPLVSNLLVDPYIGRVYGQVFSMDQGNIMIMLIMLGLLLLLPVFLMIVITKGKNRMEYFYTDAYLSGANTKKPFHFRGPMGREQTAETQNYYLEELFGEKRLFAWGTILSTLLLFGLGGALFV